MLRDIRVETAEVQRTFDWAESKREAVGLSRLRARSGELEDAIAEIAAQILESEEVAGVADAREAVAKKRAELLDHPDMDALKGALKDARKQARRDGAALYEAREQHKAALDMVTAEIRTRTAALIDGMANSAK